MRLWVMSDIHADIRGNDYVPPNDVEADMLVIAGDVMSPASLAMPWLRRVFGPDLPIVYVPGNHCYYSDPTSPETKTTWEWQRENVPSIAADNGIVWLDDGVAVFDGVRIIGATLWTDLSARPPYMSFADAQRAARAMNDYRLIKVGAGRSRDTLAVGQTVDAHKVSRAFIAEALAKPFDGDTVVVTHHGPSLRSLSGWSTPERAPSFSDLDWCYASDCELLMHGPHAPSLWIHGHIHSNRDYYVDKVRVLANPRGYPLHFSKNAPRENPHFDPRLVVEVGLDYLPALKI